MISQKLGDRDRVLIVDQQRRLLRRSGVGDDVDLRTAGGQLCPIFDLLQRFQRDVTKVKKRYKVTRQGPLGRPPVESRRQFRELWSNVRGGSADSR